MRANIQMLKEMRSGYKFEHSEVVDPFDDIVIKSVAEQPQGYGSSGFIIKTYEDGSIIETQKIEVQKEMLTAMRQIGDSWE